MKRLVRTLAVLSAVSAYSFLALAEENSDDAAVDSETVEETAQTTDDENASTNDNEEASEASDEEAADDDLPKPVKKSEKHFHILPYCRAAEGTVEILLPGAQEWAPVQEGKFYALGATYRTRGSHSRMTIKFGKEVEVVAHGSASFSTRAQSLEERSRTIALLSGTISVKLPRNFPNGLFIVSAPGYKAINLKGHSRYAFTPSADGDGDTSFVRCVTGEMTLEGRHFYIATMKAADEIKIRTTKDFLFSGLYGSRGDYLVRLDQGCRLIKDFTTGESKKEEKYLEWKLSPQTAVRIMRAVPAIGEKMAVSIMTFDATGEMKNRCAFTENTPEVNSGELRSSSKKERDEFVKKAAEVTDEPQDGAASGDEESAEGDEKSGDEDADASEKKEEKASDESDDDLGF